VTTPLNAIAKMQSEKAALLLNRANSFIVILTES